MIHARASPESYRRGESENYPVAAIWLKCAKQTYKLLEKTDE
ncbi:MAG: hypothetical protein QY302_03885 [Anaerolineales bacterium]|nr:MAG: hypothetical protein QY302_03885 [Anaerolineales bacterium]